MHVEVLRMAQNGGIERALKAGVEVTNTSPRERFGIEPQNSATASRYIKEAVEQGVIRPYDELAGRKFMKYVPHWA